MAGAVATVGDQRWHVQHRFLARAVVCCQDVALPVPLHLGARNATADALRPVHETWLEGPDSGGLGLDHGRLPRAGSAPVLRCGSAHAPVGDWWFAPDFRDRILLLAPKERGRTRTGSGRI